MRLSLGLFCLALLVGTAGAQNTQVFEARLTPLPLDFVTEDGETISYERCKTRR